MNMRRLYTLLVAWCTLMIGPGALVAFGVFGRIDMNSNIPGIVVLPWIVGYLAQLAVFMWIMNIVGEQKVLWWLLASLLPWAIDWTLPVSALYVLLWFPIMIALTGWIALVARRAESLQQHGIRATGVVLEVLKPWMNVVINNVYIKRKVRLRIEREDGAPAYEGLLKGLFMLGEIPSAGDRIPLLVDAAKPQRFEYEKGASPTRAAPVRAAAASVASPGSIADELVKLADLRDRGALTDSEFDAAKKKLLRH
jgi:hypothetical protein